MACSRDPLASPDNPLLLQRQTLGFLTPERIPWGADPLFQDGRIILPGAAGAAASVGTAATAAANADKTASGVAASAFQAAIATVKVPMGFVGVVFNVFARPGTLLGYYPGHVSFGFNSAGRLSILPATVVGLERSRKNPLRVCYTASEGTSFVLFATNSSTATWHAVEGYMEGFLMRRDLYRLLIGEDA